MRRQFHCHKCKTTLSFDFFGLGQQGLAPQQQNNQN
jgi:hypothetical protein